VSSWTEPGALQRLCCPRDRSPLIVDPERQTLRCAGAVAHSFPLRLEVADFVGASDDPGHFRGWAAILYDLVMRLAVIPFVFGIRAERLRRLHRRAAASARGAALLDVPCGTGAFSIPVVRRAAVGEYLGLDLSGDMLAIAGRRLRGYSRPARLARADLRALPIRDGAAAVALCSLGLHLLDTHGIALSELRRALSPGGLLLGCAPAAGVDPNYDRRSVGLNRRFGVRPLDPARFATELEAARFAGARFETAGGLLLFEAEAA
jgi:SAM-dependent methyltransferase